MINFPVSGVNCPAFVPPLVALVISSLTAAAGVSGAFLLLPFQMSVLGFVSPAVSPTNLIYNIVALPGGIYRYGKERRITWPLAWVLVAGALPGVFLGAFVRIRYLPDPRSAKLFVGAVLLYLGCRLLYDLRKPVVKGPGPGVAAVKTRLVSWKKIEYEFRSERFGFNPVVVWLLGLAVGLVGGIYGVGGGAIIAPFLIANLGLPVYTIAGAALLSTFATSIAGVAFFQALSVRPDWALGALFGLGGLAGTYIGARLQRFLPERWIRLFLAVLITSLAVSYIVSQM